MPKVCSQTTVSKNNNRSTKAQLQTLVSALTAVAGLVLPGWADAAPALKLHVPSPDWRDQILYFALTDRFADGNPHNNDQGAGEFKAGDKARYNGGDLAGLRQRLDYIQGLGVTGLWITPPVANQWVEPSGGYTGYHGYWAEHFKRVDPHVGTLADYRLLSDALHRRGMVLVQDIVVNHTGNFFTYRDRWNPADVAQGYEPHDRSAPVPRPSQRPFNLNDPRDPAQRRTGIYHWTPDVTNYKDPKQELNFQMSGLDDLNTENPAVRRALRDSYGYWIRDVGVDAFRVDTAFYVPPDYFTDFLHARDARAPGIDTVARRTGRQRFHVFGEGFGIDRPGQIEAMRKIDRYLRDPQGRPLLPGMINFPLYGALGDAFARGRPPAELGERIGQVMQVHAQPHLMPTFVDNHDVDRFLAGGTPAGLKQALLAMFTLPGIPVIYYGTEQGFTEPRAAMFAAGYGSGGRDRYDTQAPLYRAIASLSRLRRDHPVLSRGTPTVLAGNTAQPGALAWRMDDPAQPRPPVLVVFNTAEGETLLPQMDTGLPPGTVLQPLHGLERLPPAQTVDSQGRITLRLPARAGWVWQAVKPSASAQAGATPAALGAPAEPAPTLQPLASPRFVGDFTVQGLAAPNAVLRLVVDGDLARSQPVQADASGRWQAQVDTRQMVDPEVRHAVVVWREADGAASRPQPFQVVREWLLRADVEDPAGDDTGPDGRYRYPTDPGWAPRQLDLRRVRVFESGGALRLEVGTAAISTGWNPANGFDRVVFTVFIELPGQPGGATVMPLQNAQLPEGMRWHLRLRAGGWSNALFASEGASATQEGLPVTPAAALQVDAAAGRVRFTLPASVLGGRGSLSGARILVTTWDYDGGYRALAPQPQGYVFGGGAADGAKVMDASAVITVP